MSELQKPPRQNIFKISTNLLARRAYLSVELKERLQKKGYSKKEIEAAIIELTRYGFLSDESVVKSRVKKLAANYGPKVIIMKLTYELRNLTLDIEKIVADVVTEDMQTETIKKKAKMVKDLEGKKKLLASLLRKGFSKDLCIKELEMEELFF